MPDPTTDVSAVRGAITAAEFHVALAQSAVVARVADATEINDRQRAAAHELSALFSHARALHELVVAQGARPAVAELTQQANSVSERAGELRLLFEFDAGALADDRYLPYQAEAIVATPASADIAGPPMPALDVALDALLDAVLNVGTELTVDAPIAPEDLLWTAQRLSLALEEISALYDELGDRAASWHDTASSDPDASLWLPARAQRAYLAHLSESPERLRAAARAVLLAARRGHLIELEALDRPALTRVRVADCWIDISLTDETQGTYRVRVAGAPAVDPTGPGVSSGELVAAIATAAQLELTDTEQRQQARAAADKARGELAAIVAYRSSGRRGDPQHAALLAASLQPADAEIPYSHRPDSTPDLVDVLLDLQAERWPVASVLRDALAAVARVLTDDGQAGVDRLLSHPNEDEVAAEHVRALVEAWTAAALEHEARRLRDPDQLRRALLSAVRDLQAQGRPANLANLHALATKQLVSRERALSTLCELVDDALLAFEDPLAAHRVWQLTPAGSQLTPDE